MQGIYQMHSWNRKQRQWLDRLAKQLVHEVVVDQDFVNRRFADEGGVKRFNIVLNDKLDDVLEALKERLWDAA